MGGEGENTLDEYELTHNARDAGCVQRICWLTEAGKVFASLRSTPVSVTFAPNKAIPLCSKCLQSSHKPLSLPILKKRDFVSFGCK